MSLLCRTLAIVTLGVVLSSGSVRASQVVFGNLGSDGSGSVSATSGEALSATDWFAQGFTTGVGSTLLSVDSITLGLRNPVAGSVSANVSILADSGGVPGSVVSTSSSVSVSGIGTKYTFNFGSAILNPGSSYWVVFNTPGLTWSYSSPQSAPVEQNASGYSFLGTKFTVDSGSNWFVADSSAQSISISASEAAPIPEPGTWAAAALLIGAAAYVRWRRRPQAA